MERFIHDDRTSLDYELVGDCYLIAGEDEPASPPLSLWGRRRADYLKQQRRTLYYTLLYDGKLNTHLSQIDQQARQMADPGSPAPRASPSPSRPPIPSPGSSA